MLWPKAVGSVDWLPDLLVCLLYCPGTQSRLFVSALGACMVEAEMWGNFFMFSASELDWRTRAAVIEV